MQLRPCLHTNFYKRCQTDRSQWDLSNVANWNFLPFLSFWDTVPQSGQNHPFCHLYTSDALWSRTNTFSEANYVLIRCRIEFSTTLPVTFHLLAAILNFPASRWFLKITFRPALSACQISERCHRSARFGYFLTCSSPAILGIIDFVTVIHCSHIDMN